MGFLSGIVHAIGNGIGDVENFFGAGPKKQQNQNQNQNNNNNNQNNNQSQQNNGPIQLQVQQPSQASQDPGQLQGDSNSGNVINLLQPQAHQLQKANPQQPQQPQTQLLTASPQQTIPLEAQSPDATAGGPQSQPAQSNNWRDILHNPITNFGGNLVKSFTNVAAAPVELGRALVGQATNNPAAELAAANRAEADAKNNIVYGLGSQAAGLGQALNDTIVKQGAATLTGNDVASNNATTGAIQAFNKTPIGSLLTPIQNSLQSYQVHRDLGNLTPDQQKAQIAAGLQATGATPGQDLLHQAYNSAAGATQLIVPEKLVNGVTAADTVANIGNKVANFGSNLRKAGAPVAADANEISSGVKGENTAQAPIATAPIEPASPQAIGPNGEQIPQVSAEAPNAVQPVIHPNDPARTQLENTANDLDTPTYMRTAAKNQLAEIQGQEEAAQKAAQEKELGIQDNPAVDSPTYQRKGIQLPSDLPPSIEDVNNSLHDNASKVAQAPENASMINQAYNKTRNTNPLSLVMHTLAETTNKNTVRNMVQQLIPEAEGNVLNRAVNAVRGADNPADVATALTEASTKAKTPEGELGPVSTAPALEPTSPSRDSDNGQPVQSVQRTEPASPTMEATPQVQRTANPQSTDVAPSTQTAIPEMLLKTAPSVENVSNVSSPSSVAQETADVKPNVGNEPVIPTPTNPGLKNDRYNQSVIDNTRDPVFKAAFKSDPISKDPAKLSDLNDAAVKKVSDMAFPDIVQHYGQDFEDGKGPVNSPSQYFETLQALRQLGEHDGDPTAANAAANALKAVNDYASEQGRGLAATKVAYDNLPASMKVAYVNKIIESAGGELKSADLERLMAAAKSQGDLAKIAQEAEQRTSELSTHSNEAGIDFNAQMKQALQEEKDANSKLYDQNRQVVNIIDENMPKSSLGDRIAQNARTSMLSSLGGRAFALLSTGANTALHVADNTISAALSPIVNTVGKVLGKVDDTNAVKSSIIRPTTLVKGAGEGIKGLAKEIGGNGPVKSVTDYLKGQPDGEYSHDNTRYGSFGNSIIPSTFRKAVRFGVGSHLALTKGVENAALEQSARAAADVADIPKENLPGYISYYKEHPPAAQAEEAKQTWLSVNNLHKNGISDALGKMASSLEDAAGKLPADKGGTAAAAVAKQVRTVMLPFSHYMGGFVDKALTDRNMAYNVYKMAKASSPQEFTDQLSHFTTNVGLAGGAGYLLAQNGIITDKDASGKNYDGGYFHVGNHYIPLGIAGQGSIPILMGSTLYNSMHDGTNGSSFVENVSKNLLKTTGLAGTFGSNNNVFSLLAGNTGPAAVKIAGSAVQQHIPGVLGDVNALINSNASANPSGEAALTKATHVDAKGNNVTDNVGTEINRIKAGIPLISQGMPRDPGFLAKSELDRGLHASDASPQQIQTQANANAPATQALAKTAAQLKIDKASFVASGKQQDTINGNVYEKDVNGKPVVTKQSDYNFLTQNGGATPAQHGIDQEAFKNSGKQQDTIHGVVYQKSDDGKIAHYEQKDYDYKTADEGLNQAKSSGDYTGYQQHGADLLSNISDQLQNPNLSESQRNALVSKSNTVNKSLSETQAYNGFNKDGKMPTFKGVGDISGAKAGYTQAIQQNAAKYNIDPNALISVAAMEGLGGGVGDGGHAFGPFQMNDAGGVLTGKYPTSQAAQAYAESPQGIEDAIKQIAGVAKGLRGQAAINAIVNGFERPADPNKEIAGANAIYGGGDAALSANGSGTQITADGKAGGAGSAAASAADKLIKGNTISLQQLTPTTISSLAPQKSISTIPVLQKILPSDLIKKRTISVATAHA
jgi:hypothetical protein